MELSQEKSPQAATQGQEKKYIYTGEELSRPAPDVKWFRYWMPDGKSKWQSIPDGPDVQERAKKLGAMFLTCHAIDGDPDQETPPNRRGDMHFDFDHDTNPACAFNEMRRVVPYLEQVFDIAPEQLEILLTGGKGGHIVIPAEIIGMGPSPYLHLEQKRFACKLAADLGLKTIDMRIYSGRKGRQFRLPNVQRKNGRYKVPIMANELMGLTNADLQELTTSPRELDEFVEPCLSETLQELFTNYRSQVAAEQAAVQGREPLSPEDAKKLQEQIPPCVKAILNLTTRPAKGNFNQLVLNLAAYFSAAGYDLGAALEIARPFLESYQDSTAYTTPAARIKHFKVMFLYVRNNSKFKFDCSYILGLKLPGSAFDCKQCALGESEPDSGISLKDIIDLAYKGQRGCAELFARLYAGQLCFDHTDGAWFEFSDHYWVSEKIGNRLRQAVDQVQAEFQKAERELDGEIVLLGQKVKNAEDDKAQEQLKRKLKGLEQQQKAVIKLIQSLNTLGYRKQVVEFAAQGNGSLGISGDEWDLKPRALPCLNGILELTTGELRSGKPEDYLRAACPTSYNPHATAPRWEQALQEIFAGDMELIVFVQRVLGMALVGEAVEHKLTVLWGAGRNGKDTILEALAHVLGPSLAGAVQSELLLDQGRVKSSSGPSADIMRLRGLRIAWASETNEGRRLDAGKIKLLTGGGNLVGRSPYARYEVSFPQSYSLFLLTNSKPHAPSDDYALWKRLVLIPFTQSFVDDPQRPHEHKADKALPDKLKSEAEGILAWVVQGCLDWQKQGLNPPTTVKQAIQEYQNEEDSLHQFIEDACIQGAEYVAPAQQLYDHYRWWMNKNGLKPMTGTLFGRKMSERFHKKRIKGVWNYLGIGNLQT